MFSSCEVKLGGKKIALFGSYGWGDGEWMRTWEQRCKDDGAVLACDCVICNEAPDDEAEASCKALGKALACGAFLAGKAPRGSSCLEARPMGDAFDCTALSAAGAGKRLPVDMAEGKRVGCC